MQRIVTLACFGLLMQGLAFAGGGKKEVLTLSKGKYVEVFDQDTTEQIGNIIYNTNTQQIIGFAADAKTTTAATMKPETISRWLSVDPLAEKYPSISPYAFCGNNPVLFVDPNGAELTLSGASGNINAVTQRMQSAVGASYTVSQNANGSTVMTPNANFNGTVSAQEQSAINTFLPITSLETPMVSIGVVNNSDQVDVGNFETGQIDVGDINKYDNITNTSGEPDVYSGNGKIIHEMEEQYQKQAVGASAFDAHNAGINEENSYNGSTRPNAVMRNGVMIAPSSDDKATGTMKNPQMVHRQNVKTANGKTVTVSETYNVTNAKAVSQDPTNTTVHENLSTVTQTPQQH